MARLASAVLSNEVRRSANAACALHCFAMVCVAARFACSARCTLDAERRMGYAMQRNRMHAVLIAAFATSGDRVQPIDELARAEGASQRIPQHVPGAAIACHAPQVAAVDLLLRATASPADPPTPCTADRRRSHGCLSHRSLLHFSVHQLPHMTSSAVPSLTRAHERRETVRRWPPRSWARRRRQLQLRKRRITIECHRIAACCAVDRMQAGTGCALLAGLCPQAAAVHTRTAALPCIVVAPSRPRTAR
jgi:hypothetical protein